MDFAEILREEGWQEGRNEGWQLGVYNKHRRRLKKDLGQSSIDFPSRRTFENLSFKNIKLISSTALLRGEILRF